MLTIYSRPTSHECVTGIAVVNQKENEHNKVDGDMAIRVSWGHMEPPFWGKGRS